MATSGKLGRRHFLANGRKDILGHGLGFEARFIQDRKELVRIVEALRSLGYRIVYTAGVWDLLHLGHCTYLEAAKSYGDVLVAGVDSDQLTRLRKGPNRPTVPQDERLQMLAHTRWVDIVVLRDTNEDLELLVKLIKPDVWITSETTSDVGREVKGRLQKFCGKIVTLETKAPHLSTTKRISDLERAGLGQLGRDLVQVLEKHNIISPVQNGRPKKLTKKGERG